MQPVSTNSKIALLMLLYKDIAECKGKELVGNT